MNSSHRKKFKMVINGQVPTASTKFRTRTKTAAKTMTMTVTTITIFMTLTNTMTTMYWQLSVIVPWGIMTLKHITQLLPFTVRRFELRRFWKGVRRMVGNSGCRAELPLCDWLRCAARFCSHSIPCLIISYNAILYAIPHHMYPATPHHTRSSH